MNISLLEIFADALKAKFSLPGSASPEDQLKPVVADLLKSAGTAYGLAVNTRTETHLSEHKVRPDIAVYVGGLICGYIELKAPGLGADAPKLKGEHNKKQWEKLKGLPNLVYTDGREWALYRGGERPDGQPIVRLHDDPTEKGKAATTKADAEGLERLFRDFLGWQPSVPHNPAGLAKYLAPLSRFLRSEVENALGQSGSAVELLANEWRQFFFPDSDNAKFADAYAQTVTYAMLLARLSGAIKLDPADAAKTLDKNNGLLARTLELLGQAEARKELSVGFEMLQRSLEALDPHDFLKSKPDLWLYFYEDFLAAYDPKLRKDYGVYYTPRQVVELQVRLAGELLENRFGKKLGFADDGVVFLDPAVGTGTYPVAAVKQGLDKVAKRSGKPAVPARAKQMAENMYAFEILVGPYAVAHLRLTRALEGAINDAKPVTEPEEKLSKRLNIYLADTLESPNSAPPGGLDLTHRALTQEHEAARKVKNEGDILVCHGNPPYDRQVIEDGDSTTQRKGGWVRFGDQVKGGAKQEDQGGRVIFKDFTEPATKVDAGLHLKNLYNDYVYFWRWALWRLFEQQKCGGIVTFITASSYLAGPGFVGVREFMRRTFDDLWIIDLGGDNLGNRKTPNVFNIQTPVAIAIGVRAQKPSPDTPAKVRYVKIEGATREDKLAQLEAVAGFDGIVWRDCPDDWHKPFLPIGKGDFFQWPPIIDLFPYQRSGSKFGRPWPIGETQELVQRRWKKMLSETGSTRAKLFKNNKYRKVERKYRDHLTGDWLPTLSSLKATATVPKISPYAFRSFDRHCAIEDIRFNDRMGEVLWRLQGDHQLYFTTLTTEALGVGQAVIASSAVPDLHHLCGRGGKDVIPLYRDAAGTEPNITGGLLDALGKEYGAAPSAEDLAAYVYTVLGGLVLYAALLERA
jgi:Type ISP C-terminal specificity domain/N-6 DNA Methylase